MKSNATRYTERLECGFTGRLEINSGGMLPVRLKLLPWGMSTGRNGNVYHLDSAAARLLTANQEDSGFSRIALDFEHNTVPGSPAFTPAPQPIAAMGEVQIVEGDGLWLNNVAWTPEGDKYIRGGHYSAISPSLAVNDRREVVFIHSAGAVRNGNIPGLTFSNNSAVNRFAKSQTDQTRAEVMAALRITPEQWEQWACR